ncbi:hypothetical protein SAMN05421780_103146 [Flexibacter flexilis DSM 6793]|uniref:Uncharacterized protein n=1 Tax=Flexibacter flexilis DSM 6793 TaxID=927664 RepID=A0A1I1H076_9BACT|nr:hypothetical protein [Flexibacter flexilis]SFC16942.1 hypothetical protein SAMN05421780_103146 [Flexibacter flexilis DSM 6793]
MKAIFITFAIAVGLTLAIGQIEGGALLHRYIWYMHGYFFLIAILVHFIVEYGLKHFSDQAYLFYLGGMFTRLFVSVGLLTLYLLFGTEPRSAIVVGTANFLFLYLLYALVEIKSFLHNLRQNS